MQYLLLLLLIILIPLAILGFKLLWIANDIEKRVTNKSMFHSLLTKFTIMKSSLFKQILAGVLNIVAGFFLFEYSAEMFFSLTTLVVVIYGTVEFIKANTNWKGSVYTILAFLVSGLLSFAGWWLGLGLFSDIGIAMPFIITVLGAVAAIGWYETEWLEALLALFWPYFQEQQEVKQRKLDILEKNQYYIYNKKAA
jgi:hypothetical protein